MSLQKLVNEVCAVNAIFTVGLRKQWIKQIAGKKDFPDISQFCMWQLQFRTWHINWWGHINCKSLV